MNSIEIKKALLRLSSQNAELAAAIAGNLGIAVRKQTAAQKVRAQAQMIDEILCHFINADTTDADVQQALSSFQVARGTQDVATLPLVMNLDTVKHLAPMIRVALIGNAADQCVQAGVVYPVEWDTFRNSNGLLPSDRIL